MKKKNKTYKENLGDLLSFLHDDNEMQPDVDQVLKSVGYSPEEVGKKYLSVARQAMGKSPHNWRHQAAIDLAKAKESFNQSAPISKTRRTRSELIGAISSLISEQRLKVAPAFRNLTDLTDDDLESLLRQLEYLVKQKRSLDE
jgi:hypothetical protein